MSPAERERQRVFFALWPDAAAACRLHALAQALAAPEARIMRLPTLHLTLAFVGSVSPGQAGALEEAAGRVAGECFRLRLDRLAYWRRGGILHALPGRVPAALQRLAAGLAGALAAAGFPSRGRGDRGESPHVTLLRNAPDQLPAELAPPVEWQVTEFVLVASRVAESGGDYHRLAGFPLAGARTA